MNVRLDAKIAIITGAASGIGRACAIAAAAQGAIVWLTDIDGAAGRAAAKEIGGEARFFLQDVSKADGWTRLVEEVTGRFGGVDILINSAAYFDMRHFAETSLEGLERTFAVNERGLFLAIKAVMGSMIARGGGSIVNVSSGSSVKPLAGMFSYGASKWHQRGLIKGAALDLAEHGIRLNSVIPGPIATPKLLSNRPEYIEAAVSRVPLKRLGDPQEVANAAIFLASDAAAYITGAELSVCGGFTI